ncbi:MAG: sensor histidine kinase [Propionibacteriaceae bacterium]|nr:sensor histidine kinase [Propionibacteriaceae bacterium]
MAGLIAPVMFVAVMVVLAPPVFRHFGFHVGLALEGSILILGAIGFGTAMFWLLNRAHQAVVAAERTNAVLVERDRIARELHDSLAQVLGLTHLRLTVLANRPSLQADAQTCSEIADLTTICHEAYRDIREAILGLKGTHPERTLLEHLDSYIATFARTSEIPTELVAGADTLHLSPGAEVQMLRVVQEALTNVRKHSGAERASVRVKSLGGHTEFVIADDGAGFDPGTLPADGYGLTTMRERVESVGGHLHIDSVPGAGTRIVVHLPESTDLRSQELTA